MAVLNDAGLHTSRVIREDRPGFLPPYSPELAEIEPVFRQVKCHEIPE